MESIMDESFVRTLMEPISCFVTTTSGNIEEVWPADISTLAQDVKEFTVQDLDFEKDIYENFVKSLDEEELEFLASFSGWLEHLTAPSFQETHFQMMSSLPNLTDTTTGCSQKVQEL